MSTGKDHEEKDDENYEGKIKRLLQRWNNVKHEVIRSKRERVIGSLEVS